MKGISKLVRWDNLIRVGELCEGNLEIMLGFSWQGILYKRLRNLNFIFQVFGIYGRCLSGVMIWLKKCFRKLVVVRCVRGEKLEVGILQRMLLWQGRYEEKKVQIQVSGVKDKDIWIK